MRVELTLTGRRKIMDLGLSVPDGPIEVIDEAPFSCDCRAETDDDHMEICNSYHCSIIVGGRVIWLSTSDIVQIS